MYWFWEHVKKTDTCWLWTGTQWSEGYGRLWFNGRYYLAHRLIWEWEHGAIPKNKIVCHSCNVRHCVNPAHLYLATRKQRTHDMLKQGRQRNGNTINEPERAFTFAQAAQLRARYAQEDITITALAKNETLSLSFVHGVLTNERWHDPNYTPPAIGRQGEQNGRSKLTWADVEAIRNRYAQGGVSQSELSREYNVSTSTIHEIVHFKRWVRD